MGEGYDMCRLVWLRCPKDWLNHSKVDRGNTQTYREPGYRISLVLFFQNKESRLKLQDEWGRRGMHVGYWWERKRKETTRKTKT
jgi:hypothetical protein